MSNPELGKTIDLSILLPGDEVIFDFEGYKETGPYPFIVQERAAQIDINLPVVRSAGERTFELLELCGSLSVEGTRPDIKLIYEHYLERGRITEGLPIIYRKIEDRDYGAVGIFPVAIAIGINPAGSY